MVISRITKNGNKYVKEPFIGAPAVRGCLLDCYAVCAISHRLVTLLINVYFGARVEIALNFAERRRQARIGRRGRKVTTEARQARSETTVSTAGIKRRTEARNGIVAVAAIGIICRCRCVTLRRHSCKTLEI